MDHWIRRYQSAYSHLHPSPQVQRAVDGMHTSSRSGRYVRRFSGVLAAALLLLALLGCGVAAVVYTEDIQGLFAWRWQQLTGQPMAPEQSALVERLSQEINQSQTVNGITVTLDSATVGEEVFYLLVRVEDSGRVGGAGYGFGDFDLQISPDPSAQLHGVGGCGWSSQGADQEGRPLYLVKHQYAAQDDASPHAAPLRITLTLTNLCRGTGSGRELLAEGVWRFQAVLDRTQIPAPIHLSDAQAHVTDYFSQEVFEGTFTNIQVTSTGITYDQAFADDQFPDFFPVLILTDGTEVPGADGYGSRLTQGSFRCSHQWSVPVDLALAQAVRFGDTELPIP